MNVTHFAHISYFPFLMFQIALLTFCDSYVYSHWKDIPELVLVGPSPSTAPRLPIFSFLIVHQHTGKYLHYGFVCALLNDLFGIQTRGGCSCAGPYAQVSSLRSICAYKMSFNNQTIL